MIVYEYYKQKIHAVLDYLSGIVLIAAPWILNFNESQAATTIAVFAGVVILIMSTMTNYEGGLMRSLPMAMHLNLDVLLGLFLAVSPWLLGFSDIVYMPHLVMGLLAIFSGVFTVRTSLTNRMVR